MNRRAGWLAGVVASSLLPFLTAPALPLPNLPGDANCDSQIDARDVAAEIDAIFGGPTDCPNVDPDGDGRLTAADLVSIIEAQGRPASPTTTPTATVAPTSTETPPPATTTPTLTPTSAGGTPTIGTVTLADVQSQVFDNNVPSGTGCTNLGCHSGASPQANLSLEDGQSYDNLVNVVPFTTSAKNRGLLRVDPGNLENSFLWLKVTGNLQRFDGAQMPSRGPVLSQQKLDLLMNWILEGAPR